MGKGKKSDSKTRKGAPAKDMRPARQRHKATWTTRWIGRVRRHVMSAPNDAQAAKALRRIEGSLYGT